MAGTNLLSAADKVLPTIIGVVSFLGYQAGILGYSIAEMKASL